MPLLAIRERVDVPDLPFSSVSDVSINFCRIRHVEPGYRRYAEQTPLRTGMTEEELTMLGWMKMRIRAKMMI